MHPCLCIASLLFFFNDTATTEIYTLSLHDALPICALDLDQLERRLLTSPAAARCQAGQQRSEEHTSELQSHVNLVCRLLLEKKKKHKYKSRPTTKQRLPETTHPPPPLPGGYTMLHC